MSVNDAVLEHIRRMVRAIDSAPNKRRLCQELGIHHSSYYRWRKQLAAPRQTAAGRRIPFQRARLEQRVVGFALGHPALGPQRLSDELGRLGVVVGPSRVWRILSRHRLNTRRLRYRLLEAHRQPSTQPSVVVVPSAPRPPSSLRAELAGDLVQFDCFLVGSFKETRFGASKRAHGQIWQYTAIDVASSYLWVDLQASRHNPDPVVASALAHRVASDLAGFGHGFRAASTDNGNEFRSKVFCDTLAELGVEHRFIRAGRPQSNGKAERVQCTLLEEFYQPTLPRYLEPSITGLRQDLQTYVTYYNYERPHRGKWNQGKTPIEVIYPKTRMQP